MTVLLKVVNNGMPLPDAGVRVDSVDDAFGCPLIANIFFHAIAQKILFIKVSGHCGRDIIYINRHMDNSKVEYYRLLALLKFYRKNSDFLMEIDLSTISCQIGIGV